jgi:hypothetical protein
MTRLILRLLLAAACVEVALWQGGWLHALITLVLGTGLALLLRFPKTSAAAPARKQAPAGEPSPPPSPEPPSPEPPAPEPPAPALEPPARRRTPREQFERAWGAHVPSPPDAGQRPYDAAAPHRIGKGHA